ncbi:MAG: histidine kinase dimerization/phospho-acceptor domain-containing protein, partial [Pseudomonadota bacterium]
MTRLSIKSLFPRTLYGRSAVILLLPMLTLQLAVTIIFIQRHFEDVTFQMTQTVVREIDLVLRQLETRIPHDIAQTDAAALGFHAMPWDGQLQHNPRKWYDISGLTVVPTLQGGVPRLAEVDLSNIRQVTVRLHSPTGPLQLTFSRDRVSASNPHQLLVLMIFTGFVTTALAFVFLRNQVRPIKKLAQAAHAFGRGQKLPLRPRGAIEVRAAGQAFLDMRDRIDRHIEQRTMMLSGVSHDLRTPLTRIQLALAMMPEADTGGIKDDLNEMTAMLDGYLAYARDAVSETFEDSDLC